MGPVFTKELIASLTKGICKGCSVRVRVFQVELCAAKFRGADNEGVKVNLF